VIAPGKRTKVDCASGTMDGFPIDLCLWTFPDSLDAIDFASAHGGELPDGRHSAVYDNMYVLVTPSAGPLPDSLRQKIAGAVTGLDCRRGRPCVKRIR
jgi:hypothetical protein